MSREVVDAWFDAFRERDLSKLKLAEEFVHTSPYGEINGRRAYLDLVAENAEAFFSPKIEMLDIIGVADKYAARYLVNGRPDCDCIYVQHGMITKIFSYYHVGKKTVL